VSTGRRTWLAAFVALAWLVGLNALWYGGPAFPRTRISHAGFAVLAAAGFFAAARAFAGIRFRALDRDTRIATVAALVLLAALLAPGRSPMLAGSLAPLLPDPRLAGFAAMTLASLLLRGLVPVLLIRYVHRRRLRDFGWGRPLRMRTAWLYAVLFAACVPLLWWASARPDFQVVYPQSRSLIRAGTIALPGLLAFELCYALLLASGESFWRGYVLFALHRRLGPLALVYMAMLYSVSHYQKPLPETFGAIATGILLGLLALRHRSFWLGFALHLAVASTMDAMVMIRRGIAIVP
jgi:membrane protease YdiL (CAAX protease family)